MPRQRQGDDALGSHPGAKPKKKTNNSLRSRASRLTLDDRMRCEWIAAELVRFFREHGRAFPWRTNREPYRTALAEVMLTKTRAEVVSPAFSLLVELGLTRFRGHSDRSLLMEGQKGVPCQGNAPNTPQSTSRKPCAGSSTGKSPSPPLPTIWA